MTKTDSSIEKDPASISLHGTTPIAWDNNVCGPSSFLRFTGKLATPDKPLAITGRGGWIDFVSTIYELVVEVKPY